MFDQVMSTPTSLFRLRPARQDRALTCL